MARRDPLNPWVSFILETGRITPDYVDATYLHRNPTFSWKLCAAEQRKKHQVSTKGDLAECIQELDESLEEQLPKLYRSIKKKGYMRFLLEIEEKEFLMIDFQRGLPKDVKQYLAYVELNRHEILMTRYFPDILKPKDDPASPDPPAGTCPYM
jgi:hypothetical protein